MYSTQLGDSFKLFEDIPPQPPHPKDAKSAKEGLDRFAPWWEIAHMTSLVKADSKGRIPVRGSEKGRQYLVTSTKGGWWVKPAHPARPLKKRRNWKGPTKDLSVHLKALADLGFTFAPSEASKQQVPPCQF